MRGVPFDEGASLPEGVSCRSSHLLPLNTGGTPEALHVAPGTFGVVLTSAPDASTVSVFGGTDGEAAAGSESVEVRFGCCMVPVS